jgi:signal transduction histidine kinase
MRRLLPIIISSIVGITAICAYFVFNQTNTTGDINNADYVQKVVLRHEKKMNVIAKNLINNHNDHALHTAKTGDYLLYIFKNDTLFDWHNATMPDADNLSKSNDLVRETSNGWYFIVRKDSLLPSADTLSDKLTAVVALKLKNNYAYENKYLQPTFHKSLKATKNSLVSLTPYNETSTAIRNAAGNVLFHFSPATDNENNDILPASIAISVWLLAMVTTIVLVVTYIRRHWLKFVVAVSSATALYLSSTFMSYPQPIRSWEIFSSTVFATDWWLPSLAHLTLLCGLVTMVVVLIYKQMDAKSKIIRWSLPTLLFILLCCVIDVIVLHSADVILYANDIDIQLPTIIKIICITLLILSLLFALQWAQNTKRQFTFQKFVWQIFSLALFSLLLMTVLNNKKEFSSRTLLQSNIAFQMTREDDPVAETLLLSLEEEIANDKNITSFVRNNDASLFDYLRDTYFSGYFSRYDLQAIPCKDSNALLTLTTYSDQPNCFNYFSHLVEEYGKRIGEKSYFYGLTDNDGRASYMGIFEYDTSRLFIEINAKRNTTEIGYPELLTNSRDRMNNSQLEDYSYALYYNGKLSAEHGLLQYPQYSQWIDTARTFQKFNNYTHLSSHPTPDHTIIISYPLLTLNRFMADYSLLVLSIFIFGLVFLYLLTLCNIRLFEISTIYDRIQYSFVLFILALFLVFCVAQGYWSVHRYEELSNRRLSQTLTSIQKVVQHDISDITNTDELNNLLWRIANTFMFDINLYNTDGVLTATSRRELFSSGIAPKLINPEALKELRNPLSHDELFIEESIGNLQYFAVYATISNEQDQAVGYISIPYFSDVKAKKETLLTSFVPITNIYMLLILISIGFSSLMARSITRPLLIISDNIKNIALGKTNKKIHYPHNDEIGILVGEYNRMLDELAYRAEKLAASERENTWREMARQIAHEIKNPLTPMKLSVQYLVKAWDNRRDNFDSFIRKVSNTLIEQIDQLSFIASQFSSLAKTTNGEKSRINIYERLQNTVNLWSKTEELSISLTSNTGEAYIMGNGDQMTSVFNNLIKNAIQAMPSDRKAQIDINLATTDNNIVITVTDNGNGIPTEIQEKIFKPNFTTKSTGMGLGLAIVNNIILEHNGEISFTTKENEYTTFSIKLPVITE